MIQDRLEYADGTPWNEVHNVDDTKVAIIWMLMWKSGLGQHECQEYYKAIEEELKGMDSFDVFYLLGYRRYGGYEIELYNTLEDAKGASEFMYDEAFGAPNFIIDPQERRIYPDPHRNPDEYLST